MLEVKSNSCVLQSTVKTTG